MFEGNVSETVKKSNPQLQCVRTIWSPLLFSLRLVRRFVSISLSAYSHSPSSSPLFSRFFLCIWIDVTLILRGSLFISSPTSIFSVSSTTLLSGQRRWLISRIGFCFDLEKSFDLLSWVFLRFREQDERFDFFEEMIN